MKTGGKKIGFYLYALIIFFPCLEIALRILQYEPFRQEHYSIQSEPSFCLIPHAYLGFALHPGSFKVQINQAPVYIATHNRDSLRITGHHSLKGKEKIFLMGCSYTYGMGVDDSLSFPFLLQNEFPDYHIQNFGVPGFGTVQSLLQLRKEIDKGNIPQWMIINFVDFHLERNVLSPRYRRDLYMGYSRSHHKLLNLMRGGKIPFIQARTLSWVSWDSLYKNWPGREQLASINLFQSLADRRKEARLDKLSASLYVFEELRKISKQYGIRLLICNLKENKRSREMLDALSRQGFEVLDLGLDLDTKKFSRLPEDSHPNSSAHRHYFQKISRYLRQNFEQRL